MTPRQIEALRGILVNPRFPVTPTLRIALKRNKLIRAIEPPREPHEGRRPPLARAHELTDAGRAVLAQADVCSTP